MINTNGLTEISSATYELFDYLAYGTGSVSDNDTSLGSEAGRILATEQTNYGTYFTGLYSIGVSTANGNTLTEFGIATANSGDISSTYNSYPLIKTANYEIIIYATIVYSGIL